VQWNKKPLLKAYYKMKDEIEEIISLKKKHDFEVPQVQFWPAAALYTWACGESWENVIQLTSVDEGDLAMMIFRTADNLRQIKSLDKTHPELASKAEKCIGLLLREPVVVPT
jgi:superfamily II RNA helicase